MGINKIMVFDKEKDEFDVDSFASYLDYLAHIVLSEFDDIVLEGYKPSLSEMDIMFGRDSLAIHLEKHIQILKQYVISSEKEDSKLLINFLPNGEGLEIRHLNGTSKLFSRIQDYRGFWGVFNVIETNDEIAKEDIRGIFDMKIEELAQLAIKYHDSMDSVEFESIPPKARMAIFDCIPNDQLTEYMFYQKVLAYAESGLGNKIVEEIKSWDSKGKFKRFDRENLIEYVALSPNRPLEALRKSFDDSYYFLKVHNENKSNPFTKKLEEFCLEKSEKK